MHKTICFCQKLLMLIAEKSEFLAIGSERPADILNPNYSGCKKLSYMYMLLSLSLCGTNMLWMFCKLLVLLVMTMLMK